MVGVLRPFPIVREAPSYIGPAQKLRVGQIAGLRPDLDKKVRDNIVYRQGRSIKPFQYAKPTCRYSLSAAFISGGGMLHRVRYSFTKGSQFRRESPSAIMSKGFLYVGRILTSLTLTRE